MTKRLYKVFCGLSGELELGLGIGPVPAQDLHWQRTHHDLYLVGIDWYFSVSVSLVPGPGNLTRCWCRGETNI